MMIEQHYDEEVLIALLDEQKADDPHLESCATCKAALNSIRKVTTALGEPSVWDRRDLSEEAKIETRQALRSFATSVAVEDAAAEPWVKSLLAHSSAERRATVDAHPEWKTAGFVRKLIAAVDAINFTAPTDAVELTKIAVDVAEGLPGNAKLKATAWREYAYVLNYVGSHHQALDSLDRCDDHLSLLAISDFDTARGLLVRGMALDSLERLSDAMDAVSRAAKIFSLYGDQRRARIASVALGSILMSAHRYVEAVEIQLAVANDAAADDVSRACAMHNAAACYRAMSNSAAAKPLFVKAVAEYERLGLYSFRAKARWNFASLLVADGDYGRAVALFDDVRFEMESLGLAHSLALVSVDSAEALLLAGQQDRVSGLCQSAMRYFEIANLTYTEGALSALAYLREAAESKALTTSVVNDVRMFFEILPKQPNLLFARPV